VVGGEAGVGKTRLVDHAAGRARAKGHAVLVGGCLNVSEDAAPLAPFVEALRTLVGALSAADLDEVIGPAREVIGQILPDAGLKQDPAGVAGSQARLFEHVLGIFARLSARAPTLVVIEDVHWADRSTLDLLRFLARNLHSGAMLLIATYRTDEAVPRDGVRGFLSELDRSGRVERIELRRFNRSEIADQLQGIQGSTASSELVDRIYRLSDGNAFHTEELVAAEAGGHGIPETLEDALLARIDGVSSAGRALLRITSVAGAQATEHLLLAVAEEDERTVRDALHELLERKLFVRRTRGTTDVIEFRHALLQEVVYGWLLPLERARLHEACARFLEGQLGDAPNVGLLTELARHWSEVGDADRALRASLRAGIAADEAYAPSEASLQFQRALGLWSLAPEAAAEAGLDRVELLERTARVESSGSSARAIGHITEAIGLVDPVGDPVRAGLLHERLGRYRWINGDGAGAMEAYLEAMRLVPRKPPSAARARVTASLGQILMILARFEDSVPLAEEALVAARAAGARDVEAHVLNTLGQDVAYLGDIDRGLAMLQESLALAQEIGSADDAARAYVNLVDTLKVTARFDDAIAIAPEAFDYSHGHGMTAVYGIAALTYAAWAAYRCGRWPEAARYLDSARLHPADSKDEVEILVFGALLQVGGARSSSRDRDSSLPEPSWRARSTRRTSRRSRKRAPSWHFGPATRPRPRGRSRRGSNGSNLRLARTSPASARCTRSACERPPIGSRPDVVGSSPNQRKRFVAKDSVI
jgi:tetratricopeptide (TPR) repeat protein